MGYVKLVKNKSYYKRYIVKFRRRRQAKTNYRLRRILVTQDKRKYNAPKWRLIVRVTNSDVICQIACARMIGDQIICAAYAHELPRYGLKVGLTNYAACYCTGLLLARRILKKLKLDKLYPGKKKLDGNKYRSHVANVQWKPGQKMFRPFKCVLDIGIRRSSTGARVFGALKGAVDGGLDIPHSERRFPGYSKGEGKDAKDEYKADVHAEKIFGGHVSDYMKKLQESDADKYNKHFSQYVANNIGPDDVHDLYSKVHNAIRKDPSSAPKKERDTSKMQPRNPKTARLSTEDKKKNRLAKIEGMRQVALANQQANATTTTTTTTTATAGGKAATGITAGATTNKSSDAVMTKA